MDRPSRKAARRAGILVIVFGLIVGLGFLSGIPGATAGSSHIATATAAHPSGVNRAAVPAASETPTTVSLQLLTPFGTYTTLPTTIVLNLTVSYGQILNGGPSMNTWLWVNVTDYVTNTYCGSNNLSAMLVPAYYMTGTTTATEILTIPLTASFFAGDTSLCPAIDSDSAWLNMTATVFDANNGTGVATGWQYGLCSLVIGVGWCVHTVSSFVLTPPTGQLHVSQVKGETSTYSLYANYSGQYLGKILLTIYNPSGTGVVFSYNLRWIGTTPTVVNWTETTPATYPYTLSVFSAYGVYNSTGSIAVSPATYVYTNETSWVNTTFIPGLSSGAAGSLLLVVGLIVGMIVAIVVGRRVWGGPKPAGPAQPWTPKTGATNECSVCGRSFATPEELAAHSKSEHGMQ